MAQGQTAPKNFAQYDVELGSNVLASEKYEIRERAVKKMAKYPVGTLLTMGDDGVITKAKIGDTFMGVVYDEGKKDQNGKVISVVAILTGTVKLSKLKLDDGSPLIDSNGSDVVAVIKSLKDNGINVDLDVDIPAQNGN